MSRTSPSLIATAPTVARSHPRGSMVAAIVALAVAAVLAIALIGAGSDGSSIERAAPSKTGAVGHPAFGRGPNAAAVTPSRVDGGPDESTRGPFVYPPSRADGGPEEGSWKPGH